MDYKKYKLPAGLAVGATTFFIIFYRFAPYSVRMIGVGILGALSTIMLIFSMIWRKKLKSKYILPSVICAFLLYLLAFLNDYFQHNNIDDRIIIFILGMPILIIFIQIAFKYQLSTLKDENEIKKVKMKRIICICLFSILTIVGLYGVFIYHK